MKKNSAFTLVELLAVIIILSIISTIAMFVVINIRKNYEKQMFIESVKNVIDLVQDYHAGNDFKDFPEDGIDVINNKLNIKIPSKYKKGTIVYNKNSGKFRVIELTDNKYCANGTIDDLEVVEGNSCKKEK